LFCQTDPSRWWSQKAKATWFVADNELVLSALYTTVPVGSDARYRDEEARIARALRIAV